MSQKREQILVVEDDDTIRNSLAYLLRLEGYDVSVASNGLEALDHFKMGLRPSLILLDLMMPVMDGIEFIQELRKEPSRASIPIVVLSGDGRVEEKTATQEVAGYLLKPIPLETILEIAARYCRSPSTPPLQRV